MDAEEIQALQAEEIEVLESIYDGDDAFKVQDAAKTHFQYKYGEEGSGKSFILDIKWGESYPEDLPEMTLDTFYNQHLKSEVKDKILSAVKEEAEPLLGMSMTYTLFEFVKGDLDALLEDQPEVIQEITESVAKVKIVEEAPVAKSKPKKEQLTKAQKRRQWDKGGIDAEDRPRGWDWVDVIRHLSQTGAQS